MRKLTAQPSRSIRCWMTAGLIAAVTALTLALSTKAIELPTGYVDSQHDWAIFFDATTVQQYFNYKGSQLYPLTKVRVSVHKSPRTKSADDFVYGDYWYFKGRCIGLHRAHKLDLGRGTSGVLVVRRCGENTALATGATNAALRVLVDLQQARVVTNTLLVSKENHNDIVNGLSEFGFYRGITPTNGKQLGLEVRTDVATSGERYYYLSR